MRVNKTNIFFFIFWFVYQVMLLYEDYFIISKFGDDSRFLMEALNGNFAISDLYPNSLFFILSYSITGSVKASLVLLKLLLFVLTLFFIKQLSKEVKVHYGIICLFILSSSDLFFISSFNMRDVFLMLSILYLYRYSGKVKALFLGLLMFVIRPVSLIFFLMRLKSLTIVFIGLGAVMVYFSSLKDDVFKLLLTPGAYFIGMDYEIEDVIKYRSEQSSSGFGADMAVLKPMIYLTRPLLFNDWKRPIIANNEYENSQYIISGFDTDLIFQNFAVIANMIYLPLLLLSFFYALFKGDRIGWLYLFFLSIFSFVSFGQSRHHLMFNFLELVIVERSISRFSLLFRVMCCLAFCLIIILINFA